MQLFFFIKYVFLLICLSLMTKILAIEQFAPINQVSVEARIESFRFNEKGSLLGVIYDQDSEPPGDEAPSLQIWSVPLLANSESLLTYTAPPANETSDLGTFDLIASPKPFIVMASLHNLRLLRQLEFVDNKLITSSFFGIDVWALDNMYASELGSLWLRSLCIIPNKKTVRAS